VRYIEKQSETFSTGRPNTSYWFVLLVENGNSTTKSNTMNSFRIWTRSVGNHFDDIGDQLSILDEVLLWFSLIASSVNIVLVPMFIEPVCLLLEHFILLIAPLRTGELHSDRYPNHRNPS
jgi:hypothetical protein